MKEIYFAGGCFWGMEKLFRAFTGVEAVTAGYANGLSEEYANYHDVCTGLSRFRETVRVIYDADKISLARLVEIFFAVIDPTLFNRQGMDFGSQYQTGIYWTCADDGETIRLLAAEEERKYREFYTELKPLENFFPAEEYHQRYLEKHPDGYCHISQAKIDSLLGL